MKKYDVTCSIIYNGCAKVEANSYEEALRKVELQFNPDNLKDFPNDAIVGDVHFTFGEATADYVDEI